MCFAAARALPLERMPSIPELSLFGLSPMVKEPRNEARRRGLLFLAELFLEMVRSIPGRVVRLGDGDIKLELIVAPARPGVLR